MTSRINYNFNPNFKPSQSVNLTSPPTLQPNRPAANRPARTTAPLIQPQISLEGQERIGTFHRAAVLAYQSSDEAGKRLNSFKSFINDLQNLNISNSNYLQSFKQHLGPDLFKKVCEEVGMSLTGSKDSYAGVRLLNDNFRAILRIKNYNGETLLDQIATFFGHQYNSYRGIAELNSIGETLEKQSDHYRQAGRSSVVHTNHYEEAARLKLDALRAFKSLPEQAKGHICKKIYELDGGGHREGDYGYNRALDNIERVLSYNNESPIKHAIAQVTAQAPKAPNFIVTYVHAESIKPTDSAATAKEIRKLYELEDLKQFLADRYKTNDFVTGKYRAMNPDLKELTNKLIWLASYQPIELGFGENFVARNPRALLGIQNQQGIDIISQLISHQQEKILALRLYDEVIAFNHNTIDKNPQQILELFNHLSDKAKEDFRSRVWKRDGGERNPNMGGWKNFFGDWGYYGTRKIETDPKTLFTGYPAVISDYLNYLQESVVKADSILIQDLERAKPVPAEPVDVSASKLASEPGLIQHLPPNLRVAYVTAELQGVASLGGLGSAVDGMARGFGADDSRVILPLYQNGVIKDELLKKLERKKKYDITVDGKTHRIYKLNYNGLRCYLVDDPQLFWIPKKPDGSSGDFYDGEYLHCKHRWAVFQSVATELLYKFSKKEEPFQLAHLHDAQTGLIPKMMAERHPEEWKRGETPAMMFTFHNNLEPNTYNNDQTMDILARHGLQRRGMNSFMEALQDADMITTVSETFSKEAQTPIFGNGMDRSVKVAALQNKFVGIVNGNSNGWDPRKDEQLEKWKSAIEGPSKGSVPDLRYGPDSPDLGDKIIACQKEVCAYLKSLPFDDEAYADLDPEKPIIMYVGRYDSSQKGMEKFRLIMEETLRNGCQFVCAGIRNENDRDAKAMIDQLKQRAKELGKKGVLILDDKKENGKLKYQGVFGNLLRAASTIAAFPSKYEPCGLVQGEFNRMGKKALATRTGGFADTLTAEAPNANGYLFRRDDKWHSEEQDKEIIATLRIALDYAKALQHALYHGDDAAKKPYLNTMRTIMHNALHSTWEETFDGSLSPIRRIELAIAKALVNTKRRGEPVIANLKTLKV
jgi:starch synthase